MRNAQSEEDDLLNKNDEEPGKSVPVRLLLDAAQHHFAEGVMKCQYGDAKPGKILDTFQCFSNVSSMFLKYYLPCHLDGLCDVGDDDDVAGREQEAVNGQRVADKILLELGLRRVHRLRGQSLSGGSLRHVSLDLSHVRHFQFPVCFLGFSNPSSCLPQLKALISISRLRTF